MKHSKGETHWCINEWQNELFTSNTEIKLCQQKSTGHTRPRSFLGRRRGWLLDYTWIRRFCSSCCEGAKKMKINVSLVNLVFQCHAKVKDQWTSVALLSLYFVSGKCRGMPCKTVKLQQISVRVRSETIQLLRVLQSTFVKLSCICRFRGLEAWDERMLRRGLSSWRSGHTPFPVRHHAHEQHRPNQHPQQQADGHSDQHTCEQRAAISQM